MTRIAKVALSALTVLSLIGCDELAHRQNAGKPSVEAAPRAPSNDQATQPAGDQTMTSIPPIVVIDTSEGAITVELWPDRAPLTVKNFLQYVDDGFYDGTIFHRVIKGFMIQGGGHIPDMQKKPTRATIKNEASSDLKNDRGTIAMARTPEVDSATAQFFINVVNNDVLNHRDKTPSGFGYAVFGMVIDGMNVVDKIKAVATSRQGDVPLNPVVIKSIKRK
jgi:cyclophilin family peptidyl-prolyl cis-trans isomerase